MTPASPPESSNDRAAPLRFVVLEDDNLLRELLASAIRTTYPSHAVEAFASARPALQHMESVGVDILLTDLRLPDLDGREVIRRMRRQATQLKVVVLTGQTDVNLPAELVALGVAGFIDKSSGAEHALRAIERVMAGGMYFFAGVAPRHSGLATRSGTSSPFGPEVLTERERDVVRLVATGMSSKETAAELNLSTRTVENYRAQAMRKLNLRDTVSLVRWCLEQGLA